MRYKAADGRLYMDQAYVQQTWINAFKRLAESSLDTRPLTYADAEQVFKRLGCKAGVKCD